MLAAVAAALRAHPELALFLTLAVGHAIGRVRIGPLRMNPSIGVLLVGIAVGQIGVEVPKPVQWSFYVLFLFSIGFRSGPQFFRSLGRGSIPQVLLAILLGGTSLGCALLLARIFGLDPGGAAGFFAGSMTSAAAVGTAGEAIARLPGTEAARRALSDHLNVVFAVTYVVGLVGEIGILTWLGPRLMRVDLAAECRKLEAEMGVTKQEFGVVPASREWGARAYAIPETFTVGTAADLERRFAPARVFVERIRTATGMRDADPSSMLRPGDVVVLSGRREVLVGEENPLRHSEVEDRDLLDIPVVGVDVVLTRRELIGRTLADAVRALEAEGLGRGVFGRAIRRGGNPIPTGPGTVLDRGDVLMLVGSRAQVARVADRLGTAEWPSTSTDIVILAAAIAVGGLIGLPTLRLMGLDVGLSMPVGVLLGGLAVGWLRSVRPVIAHVPEPALWLLDSLGLTAFIATVGIGAGQGFFEGLKTAGLALIAGAVLIRLVPNVLTILAGRYVLRVHPGVLLGVCAGAGSSSTALTAVNDKAESQIPTLGYGISYAVGTVLLTLGGTFIVAAMAR